jgi:hypothetical protein
MSVDRSFNVDHLISDAEPLLSVRQHTTVDTTSLVDLIRRMGDKISQQDDEIHELRATVRALSEDVVELKQQAVEYKLLRGDVQHLIEDVETLSIVLKLPKVPSRAREGVLRSSAAPTQNDSLYRSTARTGLTPGDSRASSRRESEAYQRTPQRYDPVEEPSRFTTDNRRTPPPAMSAVVSPVPREVREPEAALPSAARGGARPKTGLMLEADEETGLMRVVDVKEHSAADEAGIIPHEFIISAQGEDIRSSEVFRDIMRNKRPGDILTLRVQGNNGSVRTVNVALRGKAPSYVDDA